MYELTQMVRLDLKNLIKNPMWVLYATVFPLLLVVVLSFLSRTSVMAELPATDYFGITILLFAALQGATYGANAFMEERIKAANMRLITMPVPTWYIPFSKIMATFIFTVIFYTLDGLLLSGFLKVNFGGSQWPAVWLLLAVIDLFAVVVGVLFCTLLKSESLANQVTSLFFQVLALLSGCFFPVYVLGDHVAKISSYSPITMGIKQLFQVIYDTNYQGYYVTVLGLICLSVVGSLLSFSLFKGEDYL